MASLTIKRTLALATPAMACLAVALTPAGSQALSPPTGPPTVKTGGDRVVGTVDTLEGTVNPNGLETTYWFEYGPTGGNEYANKTTPAVLKGTPAQTSTVSQTVSGMQPNWRYRLVAVNADKKVEGKEQVFSIKTGKKGVKTGFTIAQPTEPTPVGDAFALTGTLTGPGNANREIVLQGTPYPYRAAFADVGAPILTNAVGAFFFHVPDLSTSTHYRVETVVAPSLVSKVIIAQAAVRVVLKVRTNSRHKGLVRLYGTVSPAAVGAHVLIQLEKPAKQKPLSSGKSEKSGKGEKTETERPPTFATKFSSVVKRATRTVSRFSLVATIQNAGDYRAFVVLPLGPLVSGHSGNVSLIAAPSKKKKK
jgi:hypothetical protein